MDKRAIRMANYRLLMEERREILLRAAKQTLKTSDLPEQYLKDEEEFIRRMDTVFLKNPKIAANRQVFYDTVRMVATQMTMDNPNFSDAYKTEVMLKTIPITKRAMKTTWPIILVCILIVVALIAVILELVRLL